MVNLAPACTADLKQDERQPLPYEEPVRTWARPWNRRGCATCAASSIKAHDIEYEVELLRPAGSVRTLRFHLKCYRIWEAQS